MGGLPVLTTADAATSNGGVVTSLTLVIVMYAVLGVATIAILRLLSRRWRRGDTEAGGPLRPLPRAAGRRRRQGWAVMASDAVGGILLAGITLYAVFGGADFGGGLWDLLAGTTAQGRGPRALIDESITPVWEGNHVWLVFDLVIFWTAFPHAFASVMNTLALPLWLALAGIVLRGAGFAFRKELSRLSLQRAAGATFAFSSLMTPFFMGTVIGAIAAGAVPADASSASLAAWTSPTALLAGFLFVAACGYLAAVYLVGEAASRGNQSHAGLLRAPRPGRRRRGRGPVAGGSVRAAELRPARCSTDSPAGPCRLWSWPGRLRAGGLRPAAVGWPRGVRVIAALGVTAVVWGWGVAQYPVILPGT